jgi:aminomethyltransferase
MRFMDVRGLPILGMGCIVSRSGYTGEDGFEISVPASGAEFLARKLLENPKVAPIGLGARDSLRLEAGLCLYGCDLDANTTPVEARLDWAIQKSRRRGGAREDEDAQAPVGQVTSGGFGPSVNAPLAMGYVVSAESKPGNTLLAEVRGKRVPVAVSEMPFVKPNYKRVERRRVEK